MAQQDQKSGGDFMKAFKPFMVGSMAGCGATSCIQPIDMVKVRLQVLANQGNPSNPFTVASTMVKEEGFTSLYRGLSAGLLRQVVYTGARLGLFDVFTGIAKGRYDEPPKALRFHENALCALSAGGLAAIMGNPADLSLIRMQTDSMKPVAERRGYTNVFNAFTGIVKSEGVSGLFAGWLPTCTRAMALNFGMLAFNAQAKTMLKEASMPEPVQVFGSAAIAGFFASFFSLPFDYTKTLLQNQRPGPDGKLPYSGLLDCAKQEVAKGGITRLWVGFPTFYVRIAPHAMITLILQDAIKKAL